VVANLVSQIVNGDCLATRGAGALRKKSAADFNEIAKTDKTAQISLRRELRMTLVLVSTCDCRPDEPFEPLVSKYSLGSFQWRKLKYWSAAVTLLQPKNPMIRTTKTPILAHASARRFFAAPASEMFLRGLQTKFVSTLLVT
jgi:hypothetical protein